MNGKWTAQLRSLHWQQMPLSEALDLKGLLKVIWWNLSADDHRVDNMYNAPALDVLHLKLDESEKETLAHPLFTLFGKGLSPVEWEARVDREILRPLRLLRRHFRFFSAFFSESGKQEVRGVLQEIYEVCDDFMRRLDVRYFLDYGTLLGYHREGDIIKGDNDIDFGVFADDADTIWEGRHLLPPGFTLHDTSFGHGCPKFYVSYKGWEADLYCYQDLGTSLAWPTTSGYPCEREPVDKETVLPLKTANFLGRETWVPNKIEEYLQLRYQYTGPNAVRDLETGYFYRKA
jgi:hypothetical protein